MSYVNYKQADSRWGKKNYNGSSTMAAAGCGPTSYAIILSHINPKITPIITMKYMQTHGDKDHKKFALYGQGTAWNGIPSCLKFYGAQNVQYVNVNSSMTKVWELMKKGYVGVFLFSGGSRGGITWTTAGHYVAVTNYKVKDGKHYVYTRDPGGRNHTGWYCYETQMRGLVSKVWLCIAKKKDPTPKPTTKYSGKLPTTTLKNGSSGSEVKLWQKFLNWYAAYKLDVDGKFGTGTEAATMDFQETEGIAQDGVVGSKTLKKAKQYLDTTAVTPTPSTPTEQTTTKPPTVSFNGIKMPFS